MKPKIAPSILAADFANLQRDVEMLNESDADYIHVDIMDGLFVPNISFGIPVTEAIHRHARKPLDVHLMIMDPDNYLEAFKNAGASIISVHYEACKHLNRSLQAIRQLGIKAGVAINPHTPVELLSDSLEMLDLVCIMSVNPGFGGQKFIENTYSKVSRLKEMIDTKGSETLIEIDGGVNLDNAPKLMEAGADVLVAGSFVFNSSNPKETISELKNI
ncbi:MAG TPA: ribulose-phosphate 3-epimerase [Algoriphagus sp.]|jgi:ribulose-phosphate 3-epimerase|uniref:ribulose-phosphate 3-epimerase n=1 Tax=unclassified Algoriphagus TaxID=2641541 RepID=UPI000C5B6C8D|nr:MULTISPECIES: ribulose-phosphate 3-epimerase [unclassified Algoriphagus]MAL13556.1 ribulose-phosphate 3-epimerase [Algoriphagus sp.]MAN86262.1 ribulose-phosphate 3-epimerase [Algoriphagus sp.]HAS59773.1 ribulose-phosphate 3-epimerase [Algoriphagus sp.]HAZ26135.1 ribulose-phosphate 3-epimerase [Algoriphagus sp.]HCD88749.1 ribulose-phosphate 3-epimerase [Algoriphagus sp.]|tara:strand:+ start:22197 stop:22847 length:651 start_codon:yes stop_codon:yes gene_type:complete